MPDGTDAGPTVIVGQATVRTIARSPTQPFTSVARTVTGNDPVWSGVPERMPVPGSRDMAFGRVPITDQVIVPTPPVCVNVTGA